MLFLCTYRHKNMGEDAYNHYFWHDRCLMRLEELGDERGAVRDI